LRDETERHLRCRTCGAKIADPRSVFAASDGRVRHVFANPSGRVFEILTLLVAEGLILYGPATLEFTWFPGHSWRVALCAHCGAHLGWRFEAASQGATPPAFYGLLTSELVEGP
jgi:cereblon